MSTSERSPGAATGKAATRTVVPSSAVGWWAVGVAVLGLAPWVVLPVITAAYRETYPITDTWVMPAIGLAATDLAALFNALSIWLWRQRSTLNVIAACLIFAVAALVTLMVVGGG